jgi:hypothetical protein
MEGTLKFFKLSVLIGTLAAIAACSAENDYVGVWKATSVDMSFAEGKIPPEKLDEAMQAIIEQNAPAFDLNADGSARVFGGGVKCDGSWSAEANILNVQCTDKFIKLEINGDQLTTLPDRTFTFERQ